MVIFKLIIFIVTIIDIFVGQCQEEKTENEFSWIDYAVLGTMLVVSCGIGVFYGFFHQKHENSQDFLLGGSSMGTFPMAMSLAARLVWYRSGEMTL